jgi:hypothetical protein
MLAVGRPALRAIGELSPERHTNAMMIKNQHGVVAVVTLTVERAKGDIRLAPSESRHNEVRTLV